MKQPYLIYLYIIMLLSNMATDNLRPSVVMASAATVTTSVLWLQESIFSFSFNFRIVNTMAWNNQLYRTNRKENTNTMRVGIEP